MYWFASQKPKVTQEFMGTGIIDTIVKVEWMKEEFVSLLKK